MIERTYYYKTLDAFSDSSDSFIGGYTGYLNGIYMQTPQADIFSANSPTTTDMSAYGLAETFLKANSEWRMEVAENDVPSEVKNELESPNKSEIKKPIVSSRSEAKKKVRRKFKVGDLISLKVKSICGSKEVIRGFKVKKCVYTMNNQEMNILILKQIYGPEGRMFTLNRRDCEKLHVKFEPGLQVFSMLLNWGTFKEKQETNK